MNDDIERRTLGQQLPNRARVSRGAQGTVEAGKQADLAVIRGDPVRTPADIRNVVVVFRRGLGYDSAKLIESVRGMVGIK